MDIFLMYSACTPVSKIPEHLLTLSHPDKQIRVQFIGDIEETYQHGKMTAEIFTQGKRKQLVRSLSKTQVGDRSFRRSNHYNRRSSRRKPAHKFFQPFQELAIRSIYGIPFCCRILSIHDHGVQSNSAKFLLFALLMANLF